MGVRLAPGSTTWPRVGVGHAGKRSERPVHQVKRDGLGGWAVFGVIATSLLSGVLIMAQLVGLTRLDLPLMASTATSSEPSVRHVVSSVVGPGW